MIFYKKNKFLLSLLIFLGFLSYLIISFPSGSYYCFKNNCGIYFWGAHDHDGIWHLAVVETAFKNFLPLHPVYFGLNLSGYNYLLDLIIFVFKKFGLTSIFLYFKLFPLVWFFLYTYLTIKLAEKISKTVYFKLILLFLNYFGASFGIFLTLYQNNSIFDSSSRLAMQPLLSLVNLQFCFSLIFLLLILINFYRQNDYKKFFLYGVFLFINFGLKFYSGVISLFLISLLILIEKINIKNKIISYFLIFLSTFLSVLIFYNPFQSIKTGSPLIFSPFSQTHYLIEQPTLFYLPKLANALYVLKQGDFGPKLILIEIFLIILFFILHYGARIFGLLNYVFYFLKSKKADYYFAIFLTTLFSSFLTIFFVQKGEWWNTIQFTYYGLFLSNILLAKFLSDLNTKKLLFKFLIVILIFITVPENVDILKNFIPVFPGKYISKSEIEALDFLKKQKDGVVFSLNDINNNKNILINSSYIPAFSGKQIYIADLSVLNITGVDYQKRLEKVIKGDCSIFKDGISYIYEKKQQPFLQNYNRCNLRIKRIFDNKEVSIYKII